MGEIKEASGKGWKHYSMADMDLRTAVIRRSVRCAIENEKTEQRNGTEKHFFEHVRLVNL